MFCTYKNQIDKRTICMNKKEICTIDRKFKFLKWMKNSYFNLLLNMIVSSKYWIPTTNSNFYNGCKLISCTIFWNIFVLKGSKNSLLSIITFSFNMKIDQQK